MKTSDDYTLADFLAEAKMPGPYGFCEKIKLSMVPRAHQVVGLNRMLANSRFGLFDDPGTGKTFPLQAKAAYLASQGMKTMVLMPPILLGQYAQTLQESFDSPERFISWHVLQESPAKREELYKQWDQEGWPDLLLLTYELFTHITKLRKGEKRRNWLAWKLRETYTVVDCDEAHALCGATTDKHETLQWHLGDESESMLTLATGTPMPNNPLNAYGLIHFLQPKAYKDFNQFARLHGVYETIHLKEPIITKKGKEIRTRDILSGYQKLDEIRRHLYARGRRVIKEQVLSLKEPQIIEVPVNLSQEHMAVYKKLERERIIELDGEIIAGGLQAQQVRQGLLRIVTNPEAFCPEGTKIQNNVVGQIKNIIQTNNNALPTDEGFPNKIIIFCNLRATARFLAEKLQDYGAEILNGETSNKEKVRQKFLTDPACRVLVANPESAGVGLNFQHISCVAIFAEPTSVPGEFKQAMERIWRSGQEWVCLVYILRAIGTIAPMATRLMLEKAEDVNKVNRDQVLFSTYLNSVDRGRRRG